MSIFKDNKKIENIYKGTTKIGKVYKGSSLVYSAGYWLQKIGIPVTLTNSLGKSLKKYKIYGNSKQNGLPEEYTRVEYLQSTGTQYINTGVLAKAGLKSKIGLSVTSYTDNTVLGARTPTVRFYLLHLYQGFCYGYGNYYSAGNGTITLNNYYEVETTLKVGEQTMVSNGTSIRSTTMTDRIGVEPFRLYMFALNYGGGPNYYSKVKIYYCQIYDNDELIRDYIPCIRNVDNVAGMYDAVNDVFYTNLGTGAFLVGDKMLPTPAEPKEVIGLGANNSIEVKSTVTNIMPTKTVLKDVYTSKAKLEKNKTYCISYDLVGATTYRIGFRLWVDGQQLIDNTSAGPKDFDYVYTSISSYWHPTNCYTWGSNYAITTYRSFTVTPKQDCEIDLKVWLGDTTATSSLDNIQIEESSTPSDYEPYQEPIITNIDLTGHEPLMKAGDYADYVDYENQQIVRQVKKHKLTSSDVLLITNVSTNYGRILYMTTDGVKNGYQPVLSTHFSYEAVALPPVGKININSNGVVLIGTDKTTVADFKTWLDSNDVYIYYPMNTPTPEPLTLNQIGTLLNTSTMTASDESLKASNLDITYKSKTSS